jgi:endonuclease/exonuclease/phosphatase family metal-dependent hydrolase
VLPYVLAGDFNIKPHSPVYSLLTQGSLPADCPEHIEPSHVGDTW